MLAAVIPETIDRLGERKALDLLVAPLRAVARRALGDDRVERFLSGAFVGHRLHPVLTDWPLGAFTAASVLDVVGGREARRMSRRLTALGLLGVPPTALAGLADWDGTSGSDRRLGAAHGFCNLTAALLELQSWRSRRRDHFVRGAAYGVAALGVFGVGGAIGGHLAFGRRVGVDHDVPVARTADWRTTNTSAASVGEVPVCVEVDGAVIVAARDGSEICALADVCIHAGGPLHEGVVSDGAIRCPWHGSRFALRDGAVRRGPAVTSQPGYDVRVDDGAIAVRLRRLR